MISLIVHTIRAAKSIVREHIKKVTRSPKWNELRKNTLLHNPGCQACGSITNLQVHHIQPFHLKPELELESKNLIVLCMGKNECHLLLGHGDNFKKYNPYIVADTKNIRSGSISLEEACTTARKNALFLPIDIHN